MILITDNEFFEGLVGGMAWIISMYYFKSHFEKGNMLVVGFFSWTLLWYIRKVCMNLYRHYKKSMFIRDQKIDLSSWLVVVIGLILLSATVFMIFVSNKNSSLLTLSDIVLLVVLVFLIIVFYVSSKDII